MARFAPDGDGYVMPMHVSTTPATRSSDRRAIFPLTFETTSEWSGCGLRFPGPWSQKRKHGCHDEKRGNVAQEMTVIHGTGERLDSHDCAMHQAGR